MIKKILILLVFILNISFVLGATEYPTIGFYNGTFDTGRGYFNTQITSDFVSGTRAVSDPSNYPLVADLNNDGLNEIIYSDGSQIRIVQNRTLGIVTAYTSQNNTADVTLYVYDIDGDGDNDLISAGENSNAMVEIITFNGTDLNLQNSFTMINHTNGQVAFSCKDTDNCAVIYTDNSDSGTLARLYISSFDSNGNFNTTQLDKRTAGGGTAKYCLPEINNIQAVDYDNDGNVEYVFSALRTGTTSEIMLLDVLADYGSSATLENIKTVQGSLSFPYSTCSSGYSKLLSPALSYDYNGFGSYYTAVAYNVDTDEYAIKNYDPTRSTFDRFPKLYDADGLLISNLFLANVFEDTGNDDLCVFGFEVDSTAGVDNYITMLCGNSGHSRTIFLVDNEQFRYYLPDGSYNLTQVTDIASNVVHSAQMTSDSDNEIITSYGVFDYVIDDVYDVDEVVNAMTLIYQNPKGESAVIPVDVEKVGRNDLLLLTENNLFYLDDGFVNQPAYISEYSINPCIDSTWKQNTTVNVNIKVTDPESNLVQARSSLYYGQSFEQFQNWTSNGTSGTEFSFTFLANETIGSSILRLTGRDSEENPNNPDNIDVSFSVGSTGVEFGDCVTTKTISGTTNGTNTTGVGGTNLGNNSITNTVNTFVGLTGLGTTLIWLIVMIVLTFLIIAVPDTPAQVKVLGIFVINVFLLIMGTYLGYINLGIVVVLTIVFIVMLTTFVWKFLTSDSNTG